MGYIWLIYFSSMALAFWFAMTLMYDGDEVTKKPSRNYPIKNADFFWEICWTSGLKKKNLDQMDIRVNRSINQKALCLSNLLNTVETKMSTCASSLYLQFDRIWLPAKSCQPFSAAWHGWVVSKGCFCCFSPFLKASNIKVENAWCRHLWMDFIIRSFLVESCARLKSNCRCADCGFHGW